MPAAIRPQPKAARAARPVSPAKAAAAAAPVVTATARADAMVAAPPTVGTPRRAAAVSGPYAALAARGDFSGLVKTPLGEFYVSLRVAKNAPQRLPLAYLGGLTAYGERSGAFAELMRDHCEQTTIGILLKGQGESLEADIAATGGKSVSRDISDSEQSAVVMAVLDALGVQAPVNIFGLSYGAAIAAASARDYPERVHHALAAAPPGQSAARKEMGELTWRMMTGLPMYSILYRIATRQALEAAYKDRPIYPRHPKEYVDALVALSLGIDKNKLPETTAGIKRLSIMVAHDDTQSPVDINQAAADAAVHGDLTVCPEAMRGMHDLISREPEFVALWIAQTLEPERGNTVAPKLLKVKGDRLAWLASAQALGALNDEFQNIKDGPPEQLPNRLLGLLPRCIAISAQATAASATQGKNALTVVMAAHEITAATVSVLRNVWQAIGFNNADANAMLDHSLTAIAADLATAKTNAGVAP